MRCDRAIEEAQQRCWQSFHAGGTGIALVRHHWGDDGETATIRECLLRPSPDPQAGGEHFVALPIDRKKKFTIVDSGHFMAKFSTKDSGEVAEDRIRDIRWNTAASSFVLHPENKPVITRALRKCVFVWSVVYASTTLLTRLFRLS